VVRPDQGASSQEDTTDRQLAVTATASLAAPKTFSAILAACYGRVNS
jgi:hypothetical protein